MTESKGSGPTRLAALRIDDSARGGAERSRLVVPAIVAAGVLLVVAVGVVTLASRPAEVRTAVARAAVGGRGGALLNASGYVTPRRRATVAAKVTGRVTEIFTDEGMEAREGQVLATLDDADARRRLVAAETARDATQAGIADLEVNLGGAERELGRQRDLEKDGVASAQALDLAQTAVDSFKARIALARDQVRAAEAQVDMARQDVENCTVRAPFAGIVVSKDAQKGEMVSPVSAGGITRTGIATIVDMTSLEIEVDVNETHIAKVKPGQRVEASLDAYPEWRIPASVRTVIPTADRQRATVKVRITFDQLDPRILPDMGVKVSFLSEAQPAGAAQAAVVVPSDAVSAIGSGQAVFVVGNGAVERRAVRLGAAQGSDVEVLAGVAGDTVVVSPPAGLQDGQKVRVVRSRRGLTPPGSGALEHGSAGASS